MNGGNWYKLGRQYSLVASMDGGKEAIPELAGLLKTTPNAFQANPGWQFM